MDQITVFVVKFDSGPTVLYHDTRELERDIAVFLQGSGMNMRIRKTEMSRSEYEALPDVEKGA